MLVNPLVVAVAVVVEEECKKNKEKAEEAIRAYMQRDPVNSHNPALGEPLEGEGIAPDGPVPAPTPRN